MSVLKLMKISTLLSALGLSLSACVSITPQKDLSTSFDKDYLISSPWYGVASTSSSTMCLSKYVFWENDVVSSTYYNDQSSLAARTEDLVYSIKPNTRLTISERYFYNYLSHGAQFFITEEAHFFRDADEAIRFAKNLGINCLKRFSA